jgi:endonuclease/exonuclease/phosphatase family metal-dependent hydrolase
MAARAGSERRLRVATYNIHKGVGAFGLRSRLHELRLAVHRFDADLLFLQEVQDRNDRAAPLFPGGQLDTLAGAGYAHRAYGANAFYPHGHHGNAILSRWPLAHARNHDVSDHPLERRGVLHAVVQPPWPGAPDLHLLCTHFGLVRGSRLRQAQWVVDFVAREIPPGDPLILAGDFNDWQRDVDARLRAGLNLGEVSDCAAGRGGLAQWLGLSARRPVRTFPSLAPWLALDRIYLRGLQPCALRVPRGRTWARVSDHAPLIAEVQG